ncbi:hypothetical protein AGR4A_Lc130189 [Agrobacterium tumefaciens str. B6]|uniref:Uncharacterized protein n=1 Tax=Agrobacterium tumefaciens str. B6 TaxID=1183423 RepID=A0A822V3J9_AGRTU|nr:hypothetical protein AGR4A_Lc130189 [Agrobacterium tumefaciens str. B6]
MTEQGKLSRLTKFYEEWPWG